MAAHLRLLGILQIVWGGIGLLLAVATVLLAVAAVAIGWSAHAQAVSAAVTAAALAAFAVALGIGGAANAWAGRAVARRKPSGRMATLVLAVINLFVLPFGTALGIYAFWVLLHHDARLAFEPVSSHP